MPSLVQDSNILFQPLVWTLFEPDKKWHFKDAVLLYCINQLLLLMSIDVYNTGVLDYLIDSCVMSDRFGTRQDRKGSAVSLMPTIEMHRVTTPFSTLFYYSLIIVKRQFVPVKYYRCSCLFCVFTLSALLLLYDITRKSSFDNIRVSVEL